jgi:hypothetical protein
VCCNDDVLAQASLNGHDALVEHLVNEVKLDINAQDKFGDTPLVCSWFSSGSTDVGRSDGCQWWWKAKHSQVVASGTSYTSSEPTHMNIATAWCQQRLEKSQPQNCSRFGCKC